MFGLDDCVATRKAEIINMMIFLLFLGERGTIEETEKHRRTVGKLKNLGNIKRRENEDEGRGGRGRIEAERRKILEPHRLVYSRSDNNSGDASRSFSRGTSFKAFRLESFSSIPSPSSIRVGQIQLRSKRMQRSGAAMVADVYPSMYFLHIQS